MKRLLVTLAVLVAPVGPASGQAAPVADYHQHLFSPEIVANLFPRWPGPASLTARDVVALLDSAGITRALLLSVAYMYGSPARTVQDEYAKVRAENDWTAAQAAEFPGRLKAFGSFNPLKEYALTEIERLALTPGLQHGIKMHFGNSDVRLDSTAHVERLKGIFRAANAHRMAIVVHLRANISKKRPYGAPEARVFLEQLLPLASDVPIQVAHLAGTGPGYDDPPADSALAVLVEAIRKRDPRVRNLWFDVTTVANGDLSPDEAAQIARRIREIGVERVLFGSDAAVGDNLRPRDAWAAFRRLPLTEGEFARIASNLPPHAH